MTATDAFGIACWPLMALGLISAIVTYRTIGFRSTLGQWIGGLLCVLILIPPFALFFVFLNWSAAMFANQHIFAILLGASLTIIPWSPIALAGIDKYFGGILGSITRIFMPILGAAFVIFFSWFLIGDFILPRHHVEGMVNSKQIKNDWPGATYHIYFNNKHYLTTGELYETIQIRQRGRAEIGASGTIFRLEPLR